MGLVFHFLSHFPGIFAPGQFPILEMVTSITISISMLCQTHDLLPGGTHKTTEITRTSQTKTIQTTTSEGVE